jgi:hypothetical protein
MILSKTEQPNGFSQRITVRAHSFRADVSQSFGGAHGAVTDDEKGRCTPPRRAARSKNS